MSVLLLLSAVELPMDQRGVGFEADYEKTVATIGRDGARTEARELFRLYRSASGRTRLEGSTQGEGRMVRFAFLTDPETGRAVVFDLETGQSLAQAQLPSRRGEGPGGIPGPQTPDETVGSPPRRKDLGEKQTVEDLGETTIEGLEAHGLRITTPSSTVEVWTARTIDQPPILVTTKESAHERVERLFNVRVGEPDPRLFEPLDGP
jgi:hypothetical protein